VTFGYSPDKVLYSNVDLGADLDSRVAIVGPNGAGKSTLLKLMTGQVRCCCVWACLAVLGEFCGACWRLIAACTRHTLQTGRQLLRCLIAQLLFTSTPRLQLDPLDGMVKRHNHLRIGQYHQHLTELLPEDVTPLEVGGRAAWPARAEPAGGVIWSEGARAA